jgi:Rrf2 family protein
MLRLSTKTRYALRTMIELARREGKGMVPLKAVAEAQQLSPKYLEQLAISLRHAGLVLAERGSQGGYVLARPAAEITALEIVQAIDGPIQLVNCVSRPTSCHRSPGCAAHGLWSRLTQSIGALLAATTLADLCQDQEAFG